MENTCKNCCYFNAIYQPRECWSDRMEILSEKYPNMSVEERATLANNTRIWEQKETDFGFCKNDFNSIESKIPNHIKCKHHKK